MIYELVDSNNPILREEQYRFDFNNPSIDPIQLAHDLTETMLFSNGMGLASNQIGLPYKVFAIKSNPVIVCFNPYIVDCSSEQIILEEGCLSFPGIIVKVKRPKSIKVRYTEPNGNVVTRVFDGLTARIFQHEYDHTIGLTMKDQVSKLQWDMAKKKMMKRSK